MLIKLILLIVPGIVPFIILTVINVKIYNAMKKLKHRLLGRKSRYSQNVRQDDGHVVNKECSEQIAERRKRNRTNSSNLAAKEINLAIILICTTFTFILLHLPRLLTSVYEALTIHRQLECSAINKDFLPLWFLYCIAAMNALLVINASSNFLIYLFAGVSFRSKFTEIFKISSFCKSKQETKEAPPVNGCSQLFRRQSTKVDVPGQHQQEMELLRDAETVRDTEQTLVNEINS